jgi:hypothetical protein
MSCGGNLRMLGITSFGIAGLRPTQYIVVRRSKGGRPRTPRKRLEPPGQGGPSGCHDPVKDEAVASAEFRSWRMQKAVRVPTSGRMVFDLVWAFCARRFRLSKVTAFAAQAANVALVSLMVHALPQPSGACSRRQRLRRQPAGAGRACSAAGLDPIAFARVSHAGELSQDRAPDDAGHGSPCQPTVLSDGS